MDLELTLLFVYGGLTVGLSFLCSLLEAALLSVRKSALTERRDKGSSGAGYLLELKKSRLDDSISAILTLNTIAHTAGAGLVAYQSTFVWGDPSVALVTGVLTFLVLVVSEIIPKTLGAVNATSLAGFVGYTVGGLLVLTAPVLVFTRAITRLLTAGKTTTISRGELAAIVDLATQQGTLEGQESRLFENVLHFEEVRVDDIMTPRTVTFMLPAECTLGEFLESDDAIAHSRIPLYTGERDKVVGYAYQKDVLRALARGESRDARLIDFMRDIWFIPELASMVDALRQFQEHREPIAMVVDEHDGLSGVVTLEDLLETMLGVEIIDESDRVADMREVAARLRDQRIERMIRDRQFLPSKAEPPPEEAHDAAPGSPSPSSK